MATPVKILIVDDEPFNVDVLEQQLEDQGYATCAATSGQEALELLGREHPDLVLLDWMMPGMDGLEVLRRMRATAEWRVLPVIMLTARTSTDDKVRGLDSGADDYVTKPIDEAELWARIRAVLRIARLERENLDLRAQVEERFRFRQVVGRSRAMAQICDLAAKVLDSDATVLLTGETGTGKEVLARCIHGEGHRAKGAFVPVNCGAMAENLLESELFGHRKGAFTGALNDRAGLFESADGGTLFLDEVGEMPASLQVRLLRVLQEGEVRRVGEERFRRVNVRIMAATHRDLQAEVTAGRFRDDLYYRLSVFPIRLPPLRERREDIPELVHHFLARRAEGGPTTLTARAVDALCRYDWPGNVRELHNEVERACLLAGAGTPVDVVHLSERITGGPGLAPAERTGTLRNVLHQVEREMIEQALVRCQGNRTHAARALGVSRWGLVQKIREYGLGESGC